MQAPFTCMIADDNELDRLAALALVQRHSFLKVIGVFAGADALLKAAELQTPDVLFLDVDMPHLSGLELRGKLMHIHACIFITSYPEYAVESFEKQALDFIVKPLKRDRFEKTMERLHDYLTLKEKAELVNSSLGGDSIYIKEGHDNIKIQKHTILYLEALKDYTRIVTKERKYCVLAALGNLLKEPDFNSFTRIHRSYAVHSPLVSRISSSSVFVNEHELPVGRSFKTNLEELAKTIVVKDQDK